MDRVLEVIEAQVLHYRVDNRTLSGTTIQVTNALISVAVVDANGKVIRGHGEVQMRGTGTGDSRQPSLALIRETLESLHGRSIDFSSTTTARRAITAFMDEVGAKASKSHEESALEVLPRRLGGTLFGIESALVNLASEVLAIPEAEFLVEEPVQDSSIALYPMVLPSELLSDEALTTILSEPAFSHPGASVWVDFGKRLAKGTTLRWIRLLLRRPEFRNSQATVYVYRPLRKGLETQYPDLVAQSERVLSREFSDRVVIVGDVFSTHVDVPSSLREKKNFAIAVKPSAVGGVISTLDLLQPVLDMGGVSVFLLDNASGTAVARACLVHLAQSHPSIKGVVTPELNSDDREFDGTLTLTTQFWENILRNKNAKIETTGNIFRDELHERPNYYEEEKYLGAVGVKGAKLRLLQKAALLKGFNTRQYSQAAFSIEDNDGEVLTFFASATPINSAAAKAICNHKETTRFILHRAGVPVPQGRSFPNGDFDTARRFAAQLGYPVVVKPAMGTQGIGVVAGIQNEEELDLAFYNFASSRLSNQGFIVEKHIFGEEHRIAVIGDRVISAVRREAASVIGDGYHSVSELIMRKNVFRRTNPQLGSSPITYTPDTIHMLEEQGLTVLSVPAKDAKIILSSSSNISQGGDSRELTDQLHPSIIEASIAAVRAVPGLNYCGVDFLLEDPSLPLDQQSAGVCELNAQAAAGTAEYPLFGTARPVPRTAVEECVKMFDLHVAPPKDLDRVAVRLKIRGRVTGVGYRNWFVKWAREFGVVGRIWNVSSRSVHVEMMGNSMAIAALSAGAVTGSSKAKPTSVITEHIPELDYEDFMKVAGKPKKKVAKPSGIRRLAKWLNVG